MKAGTAWLFSVVFYLTFSYMSYAVEDTWPEINSQHRPGAYWHCMGNALDEANITRELETYHEAGMGGVHIIPIYGAKGYEDRYVEYLSPRWMELLAHIVSEAERLGMWVDMTTGTGWNFGGPGITGDLACARVQLKIDKLRGPDDYPKKLSIDWANIQSLVGIGPEGKRVDLMEYIVPGGKLEWKPPAQDWKLYTVFQSPTNKEVERAAPGGVGVMINPYYALALEQYLKRFDEAFARYDGPLPRAMYHDSYEYNNDWSPDLFAQFERRRGYRLQDYLPEFFAEKRDDTVARVKCDYRETVSDLMLESFIQPWADWANGRGFLTRNQSHGSPGNLLDLYGTVDIPETEMFNKDRDPLVAKFASSAAHVMGRNKVAAEFGTWLKDHFNVRLADLKDLVDELFVSGVNQVLYHGTTYSPAEDPWPGWLFYASTQMNPRNAIWHDVRGLNDYIARCQSVLQAGRPDNDILVYWPIHDMWHDAEGRRRDLTVHHTEWLTDQPVGSVARQLWEQGYTFDYISDRQLQQCKVGDGQMQTPGGSYRAMLVPACDRIPLATFEKMIDLIDAGSTIIWSDRLPADVPGLASLETRRDQLKELLTRIRKSGRLICGDDIPGLLQKSGINPEPLASIPGLSFVRCTHEEGRYYFIANREKERAFSGWLPLSGSPKSVYILNPITGSIGLAKQRQASDTVTEVFLEMLPGQSLVLKTLSNRNGTGAVQSFMKENGSPIIIDSPWDVTFIDGGPTLPDPMTMSQLVSWTEQGGQATERFAGTARYTTTFDLPEHDANAWRIDLGEVAESARIRVNGKDFGILFMPPIRIDVPGELLQDTGNKLEVEVTNLSANRIRGLDQDGVNWRKFYDINFVNIDYESFDASKWPVHPSGLLGPVTLTPLALMAG